MLVAGIGFIMCLLLTAELAEGIEKELFSRAQLTKGMGISAAVFLLALVLTSFSAIFLGVDLGRNLKKQQKWRKRL